MMVPAGEPTEQVVRDLIGLLDEGDLIVDGSNSNFRTPSGGPASSVGGDRFRGRRCLRRDLGPPGGVLHDAGGARRTWSASAPPSTPWPPPEGWSPRRGSWGRPLREDELQRDRVRHPPGVRRGIRDPEGLRVRPRPAPGRRGGGGGAWSGRGFWTSWPPPWRRIPAWRRWRATSRTPGKVGGRCWPRSTRTCRRPSPPSRCSPGSPPARTSRSRRRSSPRSAASSAATPFAPIRVAVSPRTKLQPPDPTAIVIFGASGDLTHGSSYRRVPPLSRGAPPARFPSWGTPAHR